MGPDLQCPDSILKEGKMKEARFVAFLVLGLFLFSCLAEAAEEETSEVFTTSDV